MGSDNLVMKLRQFDLIAFDWDGTLFDSTQTIVRCIQAAVCDVGGEKPTDKAAAYVIGLGLAQALAHAAPDVPLDKHLELGTRYRHHYARHCNDLTLFPGILPMLDMLKARGHLMAVATGKSRQGLDEALKSVELKNVFDGSRTADETAGKPDPQMLFELMNQFSVRASRILMIGDTTHDLQMALNAGCASVGVSYGAHEPGTFAVLKPLYVAHAVHDLHAWLQVNA